MIAGLEMIDPSEAENVYSDSNLVVQTLNEWQRAGAAWLEARAGPVKTSISCSARGRSRRSGPTFASSGCAPTTARAGTSTPTPLATAYMRDLV